MSEVTLTLDEAANLLKTTPEALSAFEQAYHTAALREKEASDNFFDKNSRDMVKETRKRHASTPESIQSKQKQLTERIVHELLTLDGTKLLPEERTDLVTNEDLAELPLSARPQLTGTLCQKDLGGDSYPAVLYSYQQFLDAKTEQERFFWINHFKQGLDTLDLDGITYEILGCNMNSIGHWFPALKEAADKQGFFKIPETKIVKVPMPILQLTHLEYQSLRPVTLDIVNKWAMEAFDLDENKTYFVKTGTYSSKFDFRNAKVTTPQEVRELGSYLLYIHHYANRMGSPLTMPHPIVGVSTTNEWCVREYIEDKENNPCIYHGMPLHTEYRVFIDCDQDEVLAIAPYWEPTVMKNRFTQESDADSADCKHDYVIYSMHEDVLMSRFHANKNQVANAVKNMLPDLNLSGQWSLDIMQNGDDFWLIDMALAQNSALSNYIPVEKRKRTEENWLPNFSNL